MLQEFLVTSIGLLTRGTPSTAAGLTGGSLPARFQANFCLEPLNLVSLCYRKSQLPLPFSKYAAYFTI